MQTQTPPPTRARRTTPLFATPSGWPAPGRRPATAHICADGQIASGPRQQCEKCLTAETIATVARLKSLLAHPACNPLTTGAALRELAPHMQPAISTAHTA